MTSDLLPSVAPPDLDRRHALFLDFDGTLVEMAPRPDQVAVGHALAPLLDGLADILEGAVAVVSGRGLADLERRIQATQVTLVGLHGFERKVRGGGRRSAPAEALAPARHLFEQFSQVHPDVFFEDKQAGLALHFRQAPELEAECEALARHAASLVGDEYTLIGGKKLIELRPRAANKGTAIATLLEEAPFRGRIPVFVGDDVTDEDGFAAVNQLGGVSVVVGSPPATGARYRIPTVADVLDWLGRSLTRALGFDTRGEERS